VQADFGVANRGTAELIPQHPLTVLVNKVRTNEGGLMNVSSPKDRWTRTLQDFFCTGNAFWQVFRTRGGRAAELWRLDPARMAIESSETEWVKRYWYEVAGKWYPIDCDDVVHWQHPDPFSEGSTQWFGIPPILSAYRSLAIDTELEDTMKVTLQNRGVPSVALLLRDMDGAQATSDEISAIRSEWRRRFGGANRGDVAVLQDMDIEVIGMNWKDMALTEAIAVPESRMAMVMGVPQILLGKSGTQSDPTRANYREAKEHFWLDRIRELHCSLAEVLDQSLLPQVGGNRFNQRCVFDDSQVPVIQEARLRRAEKAKDLFTASVVSRHVAQNLGGLPQHGPDVFHRSSLIDGIIPADATEEDVTDEDATNLPTVEDEGDDDATQADDQE